MIKQLSIYESQILHKNASNLFGIFLEDINFSVDGGLNANKLNNYSFDSFYPPKGTSMFGDLLFKEHLKPVYDRLRFWEITGFVQSCNKDSKFKSGWFARVVGDATLKNNGNVHLTMPKHACTILDRIPRNSVRDQQKNAGNKSKSARADLDISLDAVIREK